MEKLHTFWNELMQTDARQRAVWGGLIAGLFCTVWAFGMNGFWQGIHLSGVPLAHKPNPWAGL